MAVADWPAFGTSSLDGYRYGSRVSGLPVNEPGRPYTSARSLLERVKEFDGVGDNEVNYSYCSKGQRSGCDPDQGLSIPISVNQGSHSEHDISDDTDDSENRVVRDSETEEDNSSCLSEKSSHSGRIERERVRQICQEWMKIGPRRPSPHTLHLNSHSRPHWLGENEFERGSVVRDWVQMSAQQRKNRGSLRDRDAEASSQIEQVRNESVIRQPGCGAKRPFQRICGRQTLLDLLQRAQHEKKGELKALLNRKPVSDFPHRNRIQTHLKGRFLRNERFIPEKKPSSMAAKELGLLRQRRPVSGIRQEFFSKLDNSCMLNNITESDSSSGDGNVSESECTCKEQGITLLRTASDSENTSDENWSHNNFTTQVRDAEQLVPSLGISGSQKEVSRDRSVCVGLEKILDSEATLQGIPGNEEEMKSDISKEWSSETEDTNYSGHQEHCEFSSDISHVTELESNPNEEVDSIGSSARFNELQESLAETADVAPQQLSDQWFDETFDSSPAEQDQMLELREEWPSQHLQEATDTWQYRPSMEVGESIRRPCTFYHPDEDNAGSMELNGLSSRRCVSNLLQSSFRESLDHVLRSHMRRFALVSGEWELNYTSPSLSIVEQSGREDNEDQDSVPYAVERYPFVTLSHSFWDEELQDENLPPNFSNQHFSTECDVINESRVDMARLHERMNNMQNMLGHCMNMQIELQNSIQQEVSAALNRSITPKDESSEITNHESQWDSISRGICCLCSVSSIESLLYRCGHICTCSKCAEELVRCTGRCPMCQDPVLDAVRVAVLMYF